MNNLLILLILVTAAFFYKAFQTAKLRTEIKDLEQQQVIVLSQKKSSEVRTGFIGEKIAPLLDVFPEDARDGRDLISLGMPIDYINFSKDNIMFIEVKTGNARLSAKQQHIKTQVENGQITWHTVRIK